MTQMQYKIDSTLNLTLKHSLLNVNATNYEFPPDIILRKLPKQLEVMSNWLPTDWSMQQEDCLYTWLKELSDRMILILTDNIHDDDFQSSRVDVKRQKTIDIEDSDKKESRKQFMLAWLSKFPDHIIEYDAQDYFTFSLYLTFQIPQDTWSQVRKRKQEDLQNYRIGKEEKVAKAKSVAPVIIKFKMHELFPKGNLHIRLISVMNTTGLGSSMPESRLFKYPIDQRLVNDPTCLLSLLAESAVKFHLCQ
ncbi:hypothetical protein CU097_002636 [Rhizopus azygosporus]|uniref:Uncharacterized protein n=1 Tax=Rhizopus azygosporus TaxID=86630 RepID=A0A367JJS8_RHIAZ|nr:hypothetical protein CU097_002636 [Rhizopus azygosporus]